MEGTIYYTSVLLDCKCLTELHSDCGDCSFLYIYKKKKDDFQYFLTSKRDLQYKNCKAQQCGCLPPPPQEKVVQKRFDKSRNGHDQENPYLLR